MTVVGKATRLAPRWRIVQQQNLLRLPPCTQAARQAARRQLALSSFPRHPWPGSPRQLSVSGRLHAEQKPTRTSPPSQEECRSTELPAFSLDGLGISKKMKLVIIGILCTFGSMETWMYCKWIWPWWKGEDDNGQGDKDA